MPTYSSYNGYKWAALEIEQKILQLFSSENIMAYSCTWLSLDRFDDALDWVSKSNNHKAVFLALFDPCNIEFPTHPRIFVISNEDIIFWLLTVNQCFKEYEISEILPSTIEEYFICYQRKITPPRTQLYQALKYKNGIITISGGNHQHVNAGVENYHGLDDYVEHGTEDDDASFMPNDIFSLGNIDSWRRSFLNIVCETTQHHPDNVFLSEKTFKPIIGMRPFIHYGPPRFSEMLESRGFQTFNSDFNYSPKEAYHDQVDQILNVVKSIYHPNQLYDQLYPKIEHNRKHLPEAANQEWQRVQDLVAFVHSS